MKQILPWAVMGMVVVLCVGGYASSPYPESPRAVVEAYCKADFDGAVLGEKAFSKTGQLGRYYAGPPEVSYDTADVVRSWRVTGVEASRKSAEVTVKYDVVEKLRQLNYQEPKSKAGKTTFKLDKIKGQWKIVSTRPAPHISPSAASRHIAGTTLPDSPENMKKGLQLIYQINQPAP